MSYEFHHCFVVGAKRVSQATTSYNMRELNNKLATVTKYRPPAIARKSRRRTSHARPKGATGTAVNRRHTQGSRRSRAVRVPRPPRNKHCVLYGSPFIGTNWSSVEDQVGLFEIYGGFTASESPHRIGAVPPLRSRRLTYITYNRM